MYRKFLGMIALLMIFAGAVSANVKITENGINFSEAENPFISGITIDNVVENQGLSVDSSTVNDTLKITNGTSATIQDNYETDTNASTKCSNAKYLSGSGNCLADSFETDTTISDDQTLNLDNNSAGKNDKLSIGNGNSVLIEDFYELDTNASTECSLGQVLAGGGCVSRYSSSDDGDSSLGNEGLGNISFDTSTGVLTLSRKNQASLTQDLDGRYAKSDTQLDDQAAQGDVDLNGYSLLNINWASSDNPDTDNQALSDVLSQGSTVNQGQNLNVTQGTMQIPVGEDAY